MNYYERIQKSINYIEENLASELAIENCAKEAFMSLSGYYRMFLSITGYTVKEYIRQRRLTQALADLQQSNSPSVMTVAVNYFYNSADSFSRAFKKQYGLLPSQIKIHPGSHVWNTFERIDIMEKYFEVEHDDLFEKYPDIKVIRSLPDMKVACFTYFGPNPENHAFEAIKDWVKQHDISLKDEAYRIFGYNNPDPSNPEDSSELYGYEVCVTIPDTLYEKLEDVPQDFSRCTYDKVRRKVIYGGKFAVLSVKRDGNGDVGINIMHAWQRFNKWMEEGKYVWGGRQYLEEHLGFNEEDDHIGGVELYMPVETAPTFFNEKVEMTIPASKVAVFRTEGMDGEQIAQECWGKALTWAKEQHLDSKKCRIFQYNKGFDRQPPFFHVIMITLPEEFLTDQNRAEKTEDGSYVENNKATTNIEGLRINNDKANSNIPELQTNTSPDCEMSNEVVFMNFSGGTYMTLCTDLAHLGDAWMSMEKWRKDNKVKAGSQQWVEEWVLKNWEFPYETIRVCYPIQG